MASTALDLGPGGKNRLVAFKGFSVALDDEKHTLSLAVDVNEDRGDLLFKNWREKMRRELPPGSLTAYREPGEARWDADVVALTFDDAQVLPLMDEGRIQWPGWGRDANAANAEAVGSVLYAPVGLADTPIELAGTRVEELRGRSGVFRPRRAWAKGGRRRDRLEEDCVDASPPVLPDEAAAAAVLRQLTELGGLLTALAEAAPRAEPMAHDDPTPLLVRVVSGADIAPPGSTGGGLVYLRPADLGWESVGDDWWVRQGELDTVLRGRLLSTPRGAPALGRPDHVDGGRAPVARRARHRRALHQARRADACRRAHHPLWPQARRAGHLAGSGELLHLGRRHRQREAEVDPRSARGGVRRHLRRLRRGRRVVRRGVVRRAVGDGRGHAIRWRLCRCPRSDP